MLEVSGSVATFVGEIHVSTFIDTCISTQTI